MSRLVPLLALLLATAAAGADTRFTHQGRLLDAVGAPVDGPVTVTLTLYDHATAGTARWSHDFSLDVADGYYAVAVGPDAALDAALDSYPHLWVEVAVGAAAMSPRQYLGALPRSGSGTAGQLEVVASPSGPCAVGAVVFDSDALVMRLCATGQWEPVLLDDGTRRAWSDGTYAATCEAYRRPPAGYAYAGDTGSGLYAIDPDGDGAPMTVYCDQVTEDGGWTRVVNAVPVGSWSEVRVTQATVLAGTADKARVDTANGWIGLDRWPLLGDELLEKCSGGTAGTHAAYGAFSINPASNWSVNWNIGGMWASLHNNRGLSTTDYDRDIWNDPCVTYTGHESSGWGWHASCHIGSFWFGSNGLNICHVNPGATHTGTTSESTHVEWFLR